MSRWYRNIGPGALVAAAFVGPGTVTVCIQAGYAYGLALLWALTLSVGATIVLQEMSARVGIVSQKSLAVAIRDAVTASIWRWPILFLILLAIVFGNAAYEAGNISGGALGLDMLLSPEEGNAITPYTIMTGTIAFVLLLAGNYRLLERILIGLVVIMSVTFVITAMLTGPNVFTLIKSMFVPQSPAGSWLTILALIGTTVVPYNLFLHSALVLERWKQPADINAARQDMVISIALGGVVSMSILIAAAGTGGLEISNASDLALSLEPSLGSATVLFLGVGLFAAGITSAITAPLAAAYVTCGCLGWDASLTSFRFRLVWASILVLGVTFASIGIAPIELIRLAQAANALLLPIVTGILLWLMNTQLLGAYHNSRIQNVLGAAVFLITLLLGARTLLAVIVV